MYSTNDVVYQTAAPWASLEKWNGGDMSRLAKAVFKVHQTYGAASPMRGVQALLHVFSDYTDVLALAQTVERALVSLRPAAVRPEAPLKSAHQQALETKEKRFRARQQALETEKKLYRTKKSKTQSADAAEAEVLKEIWKRLKHESEDLQRIENEIVNSSCTDDEIKEAVETLKTIQRQNAFLQPDRSVGSEIAAAQEEWRKLVISILRHHGAKQRAGEAGASDNLSEDKALAEFVNDEGGVLGCLLVQDTEKPATFADRLQKELRYFTWLCGLSMPAEVAKSQADNLEGIFYRRLLHTLDVSRGWMMRECDGKALGAKFGHLKKLIDQTESQFSTPEKDAGQSLKTPAHTKVVRVLGGAISRAPEGVPKKEVRTQQQSTLVETTWEKAPDKRPCVAEDEEEAEALPSVAPILLTEMRGLEADQQLALVARLQGRKMECYDFKKGSCTRGEKCLFEHPAGDQGKKRARSPSPERKPLERSKWGGGKGGKGGKGRPKEENPKARAEKAKCEAVLAGRECTAERCGKDHGKWNSSNRKICKNFEESKPCDHLWWGRGCMFAHTKNAQPR